MSLLVGHPIKLAIDCPLPDPFCLTGPNGFYLTGTHAATPSIREKTERVFKMFFSKDLINWVLLGLILKTPTFKGCLKGNFWAPEITFHQNKYYLYYTADAYGDPEKRYVRVATAEHIEGPYEDFGVRLTQQPSIDGHAMYLSESEGYFFYTGNEGNKNMGQLLFDRFVSPTKLAGHPQKVFPGETVDWEEGAFVLKRKDKWLLFSSQGNWRDGSYHILAATSNHPSAPFKRLRKNRDSHIVLSSSKLQRGPGHCSIFRDGHQNLYLCYHAWDIKKTGRYAWIAPIRWVDGLPMVELQGSWGTPI